MRRLALLLFVAVAGCQSGLEASIQPSGVGGRSFGTPVKKCDLADQDVKESSGVAMSRISKGRFYTHNDSGDSARFFAFDLTGKSLGRYQVSNAQAVDWEDMASAMVDGKGYIFFGDIGDNAVQRNSIVVYRVPEPTGQRGGSVQADVILTLNYPDGPHNCETLMVHPTTGDIYLVAKTSSGPSGVYKLPKKVVSGTYTLVRIGQVEVGGSISATKLITGGDISPDGKWVMLRTYLGGYEFGAPAQFDNWVGSTPTQVTLMAEAQGESIAYSTNGSSLITSSEGSPCPVSVVPITVG